MVDVEKQVRIDAQVSEVFAYMDRPENQPEITPSLTRSETLEERPDGSKRVAFTYTMAGIDLHGELDAVEYEPESRVRWEMTGDLEGSIEWRFESDDGGTLVSYAAEYEVPVPVLDSLADPFVERYNERELRTTLENLRTRIETGDGREA
jgi:uncharacterized membrane protein